MKNSQTIHNFSNTVAAFDFDGTMTDRDSLVPYLVMMMGLPKVVFGLMKLTPYFILFVLGIFSRQKTKEKIITQFLQGKSIVKLREFGRIYADQKLDGYVKSEAIERLKWHQEQGHRCILISASLDLYLLPWATRYGFDDLICSRPELTNEGEITGRLIGTNCWGPEKTRRLLEMIGPKENYYLYAYGDSRGDHELLELADEAYFNSLGSGLRVVS